MKKASVLLLLVALFAVPAAAEKPLHFIASETVTYDDNIYLTKDDKKDSFISTTRIGAEYVAPVPSTGLKLTADAGVGYNAYTENHSKNNYWEALGGLELANDQFTIGDRILYTSDPANNEETQRHKRLNNKGYISYVTSHEKMFGIGFYASDIFDRYFESEMQSLNRNRVNLGTRLYYNMSAKTHFFAEYTYSDIDYQKSVGKVKNSHGHSLGLGVDGQIASKITGTAKVTYDMRDYEHEYTADDGTEADKYNDLVGYYVALAWEPTTRDLIRLSGERSMEESRYGANRYFTDTRIALYAGHKLTDKLTAGVTASWDNMAYAKDYYGKKRNDNLYIIRPELDYQFKDWLSAGVWYQFRTRHSNTDVFDYDNNKAGVFVKAIF